MFLTPTTALKYCPNVKVALILWAVGGFAAIASTLIYVELANVLPKLPMRTIDGWTTAYLPLK